MHQLMFDFSQVLSCFNLVCNYLAKYRVNRLAPCYAVAVCNYLFLESLLWFEQTYYANHTVSKHTMSGKVWLEVTLLTLTYGL